MIQAGLPGRLCSLHLSGSRRISSTSSLFSLGVDRRLHLLRSGRHDPTGDKFTLCLSRHDITPQDHTEDLVSILLMLLRSLGCVKNGQTLSAWGASGANLIDPDPTVLVTGWFSLFFTENHPVTGDGPPLASDGHWALRSWGHRSRLEFRHRASAR